MLVIPAIRACLLPEQISLSLSIHRPPSLRHRQNLQLHELQRGGILIDVMRRDCFILHSVNLGLLQRPGNLAGGFACLVVDCIMINLEIGLDKLQLERIDFIETAWKIVRRVIDGDLAGARKAKLQRGLVVFKATRCPATHSNPYSSRTLWSTQYFVTSSSATSRQGTALGQPVPLP